MGQSSRPLREGRPDGTSGQESSVRHCHRIPAAGARASSLGEEVPVTAIVVVVAEQEGRRKSDGVAVAVVGGIGLAERAFEGRRQSAGRRGRGRRDGFGVKLPSGSLRMHLAAVAEVVDACRTWRRTLSGCALLAASCAVVVLLMKSLFALCRGVVPQICWRRQRLVDSLTNVRFHTGSAEAAACDLAGSPTCLLGARGDALTAVSQFTRIPGARALLHSRCCESFLHLWNTNHATGTRMLSRGEVQGP